MLNTQFVTDAKQALTATKSELSQGSEPACGPVPVHKPALTPDQIQQALLLCRGVRSNLMEQYQSWLERPTFEFQWILRDFKKHAGMPIELWLVTLEQLEQFLANGELGSIPKLYLPIIKLSYFYTHLQDLAQGYLKCQQKLAENFQVLRSRQTEVEKLAALI